MAPQEEKTAANAVSPYADETYVDFYDTHVAKFWKPGPESDIQLIWETLQSLLSSKTREGPLNVVDMGTGTGRIIRGLFRIAQSEGIKTLDAKFYGVDPGPVILRRAEETLQADQEMAKIAPVEWISSDALGFTTDLPSVRGATDLLFFAGGGFNHLLSASEQLAFLREVSKALRTNSPDATAMIVLLGESIPSKMDTIPNFDNEPSSGQSERHPDITYEKSAVETQWAGHLHVDTFTITVKRTSDGTVLHKFTYTWDLTLFDEEAWPGLVDKAGLRVVREKDYAIGRCYYLQKKV